jgi:hypothetical protein
MDEAADAIAGHRGLAHAHVHAFVLDVRCMTPDGM